jgi:hypothetical protein
VFENRVDLRERSKREWGQLHNEELHNLYSSPNIVKAINTRWMRTIGHVARFEGNEICIQNSGTLLHGVR